MLLIGIVGVEVEWRSDTDTGGWGNMSWRELDARNPVTTSGVLNISGKGGGWDTNGRDGSIRRVNRPQGARTKEGRRGDEERRDGSCRATSIRATFCIDHFLTPLLFPPLRPRMRTRPGRRRSAHAFALHCRDPQVSCFTSDHQKSLKGKQKPR